MFNRGRGAGTTEQKSVQGSVIGATTCAAAGSLASPPLSPRRDLALSPQGFKSPGAVKSLVDIEVVGARTGLTRKPRVE